jgi:MFS family permease
MRLSQSAASARLIGTSATTGPAAPVFQAIRSVASLLLGAGILILGNALIGITLPIRMEQADYGRFTSGLVMSAYYLGLLIGCFFAPALTARIMVICGRLPPTPPALRGDAAACPVVRALALGCVADRQRFCMAALFNVIGRLSSGDERDRGGAGGLCIFARLAAGLGYFGECYPAAGIEHPTCRRCCCRFPWCRWC